MLLLLFGALGRRCGLIAALLFVNACSEPKPPLRLGTNVWPGYEPLYLADQLGSFPAGALDLVEYLSASEVLRAFLNRSIDAAALTLDEALTLVGQGVRLQVVLVTDISHGADAILASPGIREFGSLAGKRVGVEGNALGAYLLARALTVHGLALESLQIVQLEVNEHEAAYRRGAIDAVVTFEPVRSRLLAAGAVELFSSRDIPGEIVDVVVVRREVLRQRSEQVKALIDGWFKALDYLRAKPQDAAQRMAQRLGQTPDQVLRSYQGLTLPNRAANRLLLDGPRPRLLDVLARLEEFMLARGLLSAPVALGEMLSADPVPNAVLAP